MPLIDAAKKIDCNDLHKAGIHLCVDDAESWVPPTEAEPAAKPPKSAEKPTPAELGAAFLEDHHVMAAHERLYCYAGGFYQPNGEEIARAWTQRTLGRKASKHAGAEVCYWLALERPATDLDADGLVNVENGVLDWRTGVLMPHDPRFRHTVRIPAVWDPEAYHLRGDTFLNEVLPDGETRAVVEEFAGYGLIHGCRYQKAMLLTGGGSNGKSVFLDWLSATFGRDNCSNLRLQDVAERFRTEQLLGKLFNVFSDLPSEALRDSGSFKALVSGDELVAERKHARPFSFRNSAKLIFSANELPKTRDRTEAYYRRWIIIPFDRKFTKDQPGFDPQLGDKLCSPEGRTYLLRLAVEGLRRLDARGHFGETAATSKAMSRYREATDSVRRFVADMCELDPLGTIEKRVLIEAYRTWMDTQRLRPVDDGAFGRSVLDIPGVTQGPRRAGDSGRKRQRTYLGLRL